MGSAPGHHPERPFPHRRELIQALSREDPSKDEVASFKRTGADVAAVVASQVLLVPGHADGGPATSLLEEEQIISPEVVLAGLVEGKDTW